MEATTGDVVGCSGRKLCRKRHASGLLLIAARMLSTNYLANSTLVAQHRACVLSCFQRRPCHTCLVASRVKSIRVHTLVTRSRPHRAGHGVLLLLPGRAVKRSDHAVSADVQRESRLVRNVEKHIACMEPWTTHCMDSTYRVIYGHCIIDK